MSKQNNRDLLFVFFGGRINKARTASEDRLTEGEGFLCFDGCFALPVGPALVTLCFGGFLFWNCHGIYLQIFTEFPL